MKTNDIPKELLDLAAPTEDAALAALGEFDAKWGTRYPVVVTA